MPHVTIGLTDAQLAFMHATEPYVDFEGAIRTGKTSMLCRKVRDLCQAHKGICCALVRWTQDSLDAQLKPRWREILKEVGVEPRWEAGGEYDELPGGSRVYLRALKASEETARYGKLAGLTLAVIGIDQAEELPEDVFRAYVPARLSQVGFPHQVLLTPNPPQEDHWLAKEFPLTPETATDTLRGGFFQGACTRPGYRYIRAELAVMAPVLGQDYIDAQSAAYPPGSALRRRLIEGRRGLQLQGDPVYAGYFARSRHVIPQARYVSTLPLLESWDFGHRHPAVLWVQCVEGQWRVLGECQGANQFLEDFVSWVVTCRGTLFPAIREVQSVCDPAGTVTTGHGLKQTALGILHDHGVFPVSDGSWNTLPQRDAAIQRTARLLVSGVRGGEPALVVDARCRLFLDGLEAGYVWDPHVVRTGPTATIRRPLKDGTYDHLQNCWEYLMLRYGGAALSERETIRATAREQRRALQLAQRDHDPYDALRGPRHAARGGY